MGIRELKGAPHDGEKCISVLRLLDDYMPHDLPLGVHRDQHLVAAWSAERSREHTPRMPTLHLLASLYVNADNGWSPQR